MKQPRSTYAREVGAAGPHPVIPTSYAGVRHANIELLRRTLPHGRHQFYVCGPAAMMESLIPALSRLGVPAQDIHYEAFGPTSVRSARTAETAPKDCMACHSEHQGVRLTERSQTRFSHALLRATIRQRCESCHAKPTDAIHRDLNVSCGQCHKQDHRKPATFDHAQLAKPVLERCEGCHKSPGDSLHRQIKDNWVRAEHLEEGIRDFEDCVKCHRSASEEPEGRGSREGRERD